MTYENINKIKNELFGNLEVRIIKNPTNSEEIIFETLLFVFQPSI